MNIIYLAIGLIIIVLALEIIISSASEILLYKRKLQYSSIKRGCITKGEDDTVRLRKILWLKVWVVIYKYKVDNIEYYRQLIFKYGTDFPDKVTVYYNPISHGNSVLNCELTGDEPHWVGLIIGITGTVVLAGYVVFALLKLCNI